MSIEKIVIGDATLYTGNNLDVLRTMPDCSVDSIVTDSPYGLSKEPDMVEVLRHWLAGDDYKHSGSGFMGKSWDSFVPGPAVWKECFRVLKPGGHLLSFFGSRTYDMGTLAIRLAGFEIRDQIMWIYGSGFPKNRDVSKAIDKEAGADRSGTGEMVRAGCRAARGGEELVGSETIEAAKWKEITLPATEAAKQWDGWGTALKPAHEPICVARKSLIGTVAENILQFGTGAINIDGCRVPGQVPVFDRPAQDKREIYGQGLGTSARSGGMSEGRWPANVIHDGSDDVVAAFPADASTTGDARKTQNVYGAMKRGSQKVSADSDNEGSVGFKTKPGARRLDAGSAARFFYCAKASKKDRDDGLDMFEEQAAGIKNGSGRGFSEANPYGQIRRRNTHPTVKPTALMRYLVRLVTPPGGTVLDPFMGSGSTGKACAFEDFKFIGIDITPEYVAIAKARIEHAQSQWVQRELIA